MFSHSVLVGRCGDPIAGVYAGLGIERSVRDLAEVTVLGFCGSHFTLMVFELLFRKSMPG